LLTTSAQGIPLSYAVCELDEPIDLIDNDNYLTTLVSRAPLKGTAYVADRRQVHQLLTGKVLGKHAEEQIRDDKISKTVVWIITIYTYTLKERVMSHVESPKLKQFTKPYITGRNAP
jgi:hypothetical protein